jgi:hypothetical protein
VVDLARPASITETLSEEIQLTSNAAVSQLGESLSLMRKQQEQLVRENAEGAPAELYSSAKYVFRTKPSARIARLVHTVDVQPEDLGDNYSQRMIRRWEKRHPTKAERDLIEHVHETVGRTFAFSRIRGRKECYFETNDAQVAKYLRGFVERGVGDFAQVYEERGTRRIKVGDKLFPATELGRRTAMAYAESQNITDLQLIDTEGK